ncbi:MAG: chromosomal replication initiator protein DnaA [Candidatus Marinimicrobia bacterium]|nr:chromosomal replication initiator protein DnaA [Candidatus Neomarinimicrobiota bacterium]
MENIGHSELWNECLEYIQERIPTQTFSTWFEPIKSLSLTEKELFLQVPNKFFYDWVVSHYENIIQQSLENAYGDGLRIKYTILMDDDQSLPSAEKHPQTIARQTQDDPQNIIVDNSSKIIEKGTKINKNYIFETFVEGKSNQFAKAAAMAVARDPGRTSFNPLVLYGGTGLGKTHLLQAIGNEVIKNQSLKSVLYLSSDTFTLDFISAIQKNKSTDFSKYYRDVDMLLIDDIQFFQGKESTQEQFFHIFNSLYQHHKQIVLTTDKNPMELKGLQERLISRFKSGLTVDIQPPDLETRIAILQRKAEREELEIPFEVIELLATKIRSNIRELEGALIRLLAYSSLLRVDINVQLTKKVLNEIVGDSHAESNISYSIENIQDVITTKYNINLDTLLGKSRKQEIAEARMAAMYLARKYTSLSLKNIGLYFGGRDHSTVVHACKWVEDKLDSSEEFQKRFERIRKEFDTTLF